MQLQRISVKFFTVDGAPVDLPAVVPVFHAWIKNATVPGMLIDVHDYKHVPGGPGILLVGHEGDYALDTADDRPGIVYTHKRKRETQGDAASNLRNALANALIAGQALQNALPSVELNPACVRVTINDRRQAPNSDATDEALRSTITSVVTELFGAAPTIARVEDADGGPYTLDFTAEGVTDLTTLASNLAVKASA